MALRGERGARLRRAAERRSSFVALAVVLYLCAGVLATWPAVLHARTHFLSGGAPGHGEASPGDHLQTLYHYWLVGHQLEHGRAPWLDPYSFQPEADPVPNFSGWPFGLPFWPLSAIFGLVVAWNVLQLVLYAAAGLATLAWLRALGLPRPAALAGGLVFAIAPYRVAQSVGHLLGPISIMLPLALLGVELARRRSSWWLGLSVVALASIPLSGQVHLALGAIPFFVLYAALRLRGRALVVGAGLAVVAAIGAGALVRETVIEGSTQSGGRTLDEVSSYSAHWSDFVTRHVDHARSEQFAFLGWLTPLVALAGLILLVRARRYALAVVLGIGAVVPIVLALGTRTPLYSALWHALPPFRFPRVPERLLPIACLCIAALLAFALARLRAVLVVVAIALVLVDLHVRIYGKSVADADNVAYGAIADRGRLLELPVFEPGTHYGSVYLWYDTRAQRERPGGYSTTAPQAANRLARRLERLNCGDWSGGTAQLLDHLGIATVMVHSGLFTKNSAVPERTFFAWLGLEQHGWAADVQPAGSVVIRFRRGQHRLSGLAGLEPSRRRPVFCQGWYGPLGSGRYMSETHAPLWVYRRGRPVELEFAPSDPRPRVTFHGGVKHGWQLVTVDVPRLVRVPGQAKLVGAKLISVTSPSRGSRSRRTGSSP